MDLACPCLFICLFRMQFTHWTSVVGRLVPAVVFRRASQRACGCVVGWVLGLAASGLAADPPPGQGSIEPGGKFVPAGSPPAAGKAATMTRDEAEAALRKDLKIEKLDSNKLRIGLVTLDQVARAIRFPATVNMTRGAVEYAVVTEQGKKHESLFVTKASPRDIHLAMLLLGIKPGAPEAGPTGALRIPAAAAVKATVQWETNGPMANHPLAALVALADADPNRPTTRTMSDGSWLYRGSGFDAGGFRATREGSVVSLIGDDAALVNNPGSDRDNDDIHVPNSPLLPPMGLPVTIIFSCPAPASASPAPAGPPE